MSITMTGRRTKGARTPLNRLENSGLEWFREPGMHCLGLLLFALERLEVVKATLACDLALKLFQSVEGHSRRVSPGDEEEDL